MELYKKYIKERLNADIIYDDCGFLQYQIEKDICFINELYIDPKHRNQKKALEMVNLLVDILYALDVPKIKSIIATVFINTNGYERALYSALKYGFKICKLENNCIYLQKEL